MNWTAVRGEFPALSNWTYLNTATYGQMPRRVTDAIAHHSTHRDQTASTDFLDWYSDMDCVRASIAKLIHAQPEDIAFVTNATSALSIVLSGIAPAGGDNPGGDNPDGDNVVTLDHEYPNYQYLSAARKPSWEQFYDSIDERTRLVALSEVNYATGFRVPIGEVSDYLAKRGIPLFVDGTQSIGALTFDVTKTPVDVLAVHAYKWLLSPTCAGFMYVSPEFRKKLAPNVVGWRSHYDWRNVDNLHHGTPEFKDSAEKYEGGGLPFHLLYGMRAAVDWILEIGQASIEARVMDLASHAREMLLGLGAEVPDTRSHIVCAKFPGHDPSQLARDLHEQKIVVAARHGALRVSPHFYNNDGDLEHLADALRAVTSRPGSSSDPAP